MDITTLISDIESLKAKWNYADARIQAEKWLKVYTDDYRMYEELADISLYEDQIPKAEEYIAVARGLHPDSSTGIYLLGCISSRKWDMKSAIIHFTEANNRFANNSEILRHLGWAYVVDGEHARGVMFLRRAYTLAPKDQRVGEDLGVSLLTDPVGTEKTIAEWLHILAESGNSERAEEFFRYMETGILEK